MFGYKKIQEHKDSNTGDDLELGDVPTTNGSLTTYQTNPSNITIIDPHRNSNRHSLPASMHTTLTRPLPPPPATPQRLSGVREEKREREIDILGQKDKEVEIFNSEINEIDTYERGWRNHFVEWGGYAQWIAIALILVSLPSLVDTERNVLREAYKTQPEGSDKDVMILTGAFIYALFSCVQAAPYLAIVFVGISLAKQYLKNQFNKQQIKRQSLIEQRDIVAHDTLRTELKAIKSELLSQPKRIRETTTASITRFMKGFILTSKTDYEAPHEAKVEPIANDTPRIQPVTAARHSMAVSQVRASAENRRQSQRYISQIMELVKRFDYKIEGLMRQVEDTYKNSNLLSVRDESYMSARQSISIAYIASALNDIANNNLTVDHCKALLVLLYALKKAAPIVDFRMAEDVLKQQNGVYDVPKLLETLVEEEKTIRIDDQSLALQELIASMQSAAVKGLIANAQKRYRTKSQVTVQSSAASPSSSSSSSSSAHNISIVITDPTEQPQDVSAPLLSAPFTPNNNASHSSSLFSPAAASAASPSPSDATDPKSISLTSLSST